MKLKISIIALTGILLLGFAPEKGSAQGVQGDAKKYIRIGSLQSQFSAYGSERAWNNVYYEGLRWPAEYAYQDNAVIKRFWIGTQDFTDSYGEDWGHYVILFSVGLC